MAQTRSRISSRNRRRLTADELAELRDNFELYALNFLTIVRKDQVRVPFTPNKAQYKVLDAMLRQYHAGLPIRVIILKSRQTGISTLIQAFLFWLAHLRENFKALTLAHKAESAVQLFDMSRDHYQQLVDRPDDDPMRVRKKNFTRREIVFEGTSSRIAVEVVGEIRGYTAQGLHASEAAFYSEAAKTFRAVKQAVPRLPGTVVAVESTPNGFNLFRSMYLRAKKGKSSYTAVFIAWYDDEASLTVRADFTEAELDEDERELQKSYGVTLDQLAWRRVTIEDECDGDKESFLQEYPSDEVTCFLASGRPAFDRPGLEFQIANVPDDEDLPPTGELDWEPYTRKFIFIPQRKAPLRLYREFHPMRPTIVGVDPSEGDMRSDPTPIVALDRIALDVSALWHGRLPPDLLAKKAVEICRYYGDALLIWEANNHGSAFGLAIQELEYPFIYYRKVSEDSVAGKIADKPGYITSMKGKANLVHTLRKFVRERIAPVKDPIIVGEMTTYSLNDKDGAEAQEGYADDTMTALGLCLICHRGNMENPLEGLRDHDLRRVYAAVGWKMQVGAKLTSSDMLNTNITCKDLDDYDDMQYRLECARRRGSGGAL